MKNWRTVALLLVFAGGLAAGLLALFHKEFAVGQLYHEYSTMRADEQGAKLLYASLSRLPELNVSRNFQPWSSSAIGGATFVMLSCDPAALGFKQVEKLAERGNRVVIALPDTFKPDAAERFAYRHWRLKFARDKDLTRGELYFSESPGWVAVGVAGGDANVIERAFGKGKVALVARSAAFSNEEVESGKSAGPDDDDLIEVADALGDGPRIVFDESHLGISENGSVVGLAVRFRLVGLAVGLALLAALFIWRNAGSFPPAPAAAPRRGRRAAADSGLHALLRKHIPERDAASTCWKEWLISNQRSVSAERRQRAESALNSHTAQPVDALREIHAALYAKDEPVKGTL